MKGFAKNIMVAVKGACMGAADVIPGVSGGTIAFIMGIYDDFVGSLASINGEAVRMLLKGNLRTPLERIFAAKHERKQEKQRSEHFR